MIRRPPRSTLFPYNDALPISDTSALGPRLSLETVVARTLAYSPGVAGAQGAVRDARSEEHTSELQSPCNLVCRLLLEKKKKKTKYKSVRKTRCTRMPQEYDKT